jgi:hypothetical protein
LNLISLNALMPGTTRATGSRALRFAAREVLACIGWIWRELGLPDMVGYRD